MDFRAYKSQLITGAHVVLLFATVAAFHGFKVASLFILAAVCGYLNAFAAVRSMLATIRRRNVSRPTVFLVGLTAVVSLALGWFGYWQSLAICTLGFVVIDAVVLQFDGPPVGTPARSP